MTFGRPTISIRERYRDRFPDDDVIFAHAVTPDNIDRIEAALESAISRGRALTNVEVRDLGLSRAAQLPDGAVT